MEQNSLEGLSGSTSVPLEDRQMEQTGKKELLEREMIQGSDVELCVLEGIQKETISEDPKSTSVLSENLVPCIEREKAEISESMFQNKVNIHSIADHINSNSSHSTGSGSMSIGLITTSMSSNSSKIKWDHSKDINNNSNTSNINDDIFNNEKMFQVITEQAESSTERNHMSTENSHSIYNIMHHRILNSNLSSNVSNLNRCLYSNSLFRLSISENQSQNQNPNQNFPEESVRFAINRNSTNSNNSIYASTINGIGDNKNPLSFLAAINHFKVDFENNSNNILETVSRKGLMFLLTVQEVFLHKIKKVFCLKCNNDVSLHDKIEDVFKDILKLKIEKQTNEIYMMNFLQRLKNDFTHKYNQLNDKMEEKDQAIHMLQNEIQQLTNSVKIYAQDLSNVLNDEELELSRFKISIHNHFLHFTDFVFQLFLKIYSLCSEKMERLQLVVSRLKAFQENEREKKKYNNKRRKRKSRKNTNENEKNEVKKYMTSSASSNDSVLLDMEFHESSSSLEEEKKKEDKLEHVQNKDRKRKKKKEKDMKKKKEKYSSDDDDDEASDTSVEKEYTSNESSLDEEGKKNTILDKKNKNMKIEKYNEKMQKYKKRYMEEKQKNKTLQFLLTNKDEEIDHMKKRIKEDHDRESFYETEERKNYKELNDLKMLLEEHRYDNTHLLNKNRELHEMNMDLKKKLESSSMVEKELNMRIQELTILYDKEREKNSTLLTENIDLKNQLSQINGMKRVLEFKYRNPNGNFHDYEVGYAVDNYLGNNYPLFGLEDSEYPNKFHRFSRNQENNMYDSFSFDYTKDYSVKAYKKHYENYLKRMARGRKFKQEEDKEVIRKARNRSVSNSYKSSGHRGKNRYVSNERENRYRKRREDHSISDESYYRNNSRRCSSYNSDHSINVKREQRHRGSNPLNRKQKEKRKKKEEVKPKRREGRLEEKEDPITEQVKKDIQNFDEEQYKKMINNITMEEKEIEKIKDEDLYSIFMQNWKESITTEQICPPDSLNLSVSFLNNLNDSSVFLSKNDKDEKPKVQNPNWCEQEKPVYEKEQNIQGFQTKEHERRNFHVNNEVRSMKDTIIPEKKEKDEIADVFMPPKENEKEYENRETETENKDILMTYEMYKKNKEKFMHVSLKKNFEEGNKSKTSAKQTLQSVMVSTTNLNKKEESNEVNMSMNGPFSDMDPSQTAKENLARDLNTSTFDSRNVNSISINSSVNEILRTLKQGCDHNEINFFQTSSDVLQKKEPMDQNHKSNSIQQQQDYTKNMNVIFGLDNTLGKNIESTENSQTNNKCTKGEKTPNEKEFMHIEKEKVSSDYNMLLPIEKTCMNSITTTTTTTNTNNKTLPYVNKEHFINDHTTFNFNNCSNPSNEMNQLNGVNYINENLLSNTNFEYSQINHVYSNKEGSESVRKKEPRTSGVLSRFSRLK